jgi:hypothetical protein
MFLAEKFLHEYFGQQTFYSSEANKREFSGKKNYLIYLLLPFTLQMVASSQGLSIKIHYWYEFQLQTLQHTIKNYDKSKQHVIIRNVEKHDYNLLIFEYIFSVFWGTCFSTLQATWCQQQNIFWLVLQPYPQFFLPYVTTWESLICIFSFTDQNSWLKSDNARSELKGKWRSICNCTVRAVMKHAFYPNFLLQFLLWLPIYES